MARFLKLVEKMLCLPPEMRFGEIKKVLERFGWRVSKVKGDHFNFKKENEFLIISAKKGRKVKRGYIRRIVDKLNLEEWYEEHKR